MQENLYHSSFSNDQAKLVLLFLVLSLVKHSSAC